MYKTRRQQIIKPSLPLNSFWLSILEGVVPGVNSPSVLVRKSYDMPAHGRDMLQLFEHFSDIGELVDFDQRHNLLPDCGFEQLCHLLLVPNMCALYHETYAHFVSDLMYLSRLKRDHSPFQTSAKGERGIW